jgi:non-ribosomal peptide synthetase component F
LTFDAAFDGGGALTYRELEEKSRLVASRLRAAGAGPGDFVAVCLERSLEQLLVFLAITRAGAAYVPLDPSYPEQRRLDMIEDTGGRPSRPRAAAARR